MTDRSPADTAPEPGRKPAVERKRRRYGKTLKSRVALLASADQRTAAARRAADIKSGIVSDLGGADHVSRAQDLLATRASLLAVYCETAEAGWLTTGGQADEHWLQATATLQRVLRELGLKRVARVIDPDEYMRALARRSDQGRQP
jgi:hypothetical protein